MLTELCDELFMSFPRRVQWPPFQGRESYSKKRDLANPTEELGEFPTSRARATRYIV
jgi:hypothetical protein